MNTASLKAWFRKYLRLIAVLVITVVTIFAYYFAPSRGERQLTELDACKKQCAPLAGVIEGKQRFPNAPATDRRNYPTNAQCVCR
jgi:hypothetical protein